MPVIIWETVLKTERDDALAFINWSCKESFEIWRKKIFSRMFANYNAKIEIFSDSKSSESDRKIEISPFEINKNFEITKNFKSFFKYERNCQISIENIPSKFLKDSSNLESPDH